MKITAIGDLHGKDIWKKITAQSSYECVIFMGDYFDSFDGISSQQQMQNFNDIITFKRKNSGQVILLIGNHDFHYLPVAQERYTGFQPLFKNDIGKLVQSAIDENFLQVCFGFENILFTHAGITKTWCAAHGIDTKNPEQQINDLLKRQPETFRFSPGENYDNTGNDITQSPLWVRPKSLVADKIDGYTQVVGHTVQPKLTMLDGIILIDTLDSSREYLKIENGKFQPQFL